MDELLKSMGFTDIKYDELTSDERETLNSWVVAMQKTELSMERAGEYVKSMKYAVENELTSHTNTDKHDIFLKARLKNLMLLESLFTTPERAKKELEKAVGNLTKKI